MKKIAIISHGLSDGGAERVAALLANNFAKQGENVTFIAVYSSEREYELNHNIKYKYIEVSCKNKILRMLKRAKLVNKEIEKIKPDIIISFIINEVIITNIKSKYPIIYSLRIDPNIVMKKYINKKLCKFSYKRARNIVFQTPDAMSFFDKKIRRKGIIIGNPLTPHLPYWKDSIHKKRIITACRLTPQKNLKMLIDAFNEFYKKHADYILEIYGKGELKEQLQKYCFDLGIEKNVFFPGHSKEIHKIMAESSIFALTSDFEGLSNSMLEALAIGIPTICTDCPPGGAKMYINNNENGFLVKVGDTKDLVEKFNLLADKKELSTSFSDESIKIRDELNEEKVLSKWNEII